MRERQQFYVRFHRISWVYFLICNSDRLQNDTDENIQTIPTIGFNVEVLQYKNIKFQVSLFLPYIFSY